MKDLQTTGLNFYKGFAVKIYYSDSIFIEKEIDLSLYQIVYIEEGSIIMGKEGNARTILSPVLFCLNYKQNHDDIVLTNVKGFTIFFRPESVNHGLLGEELQGIKDQSTE